MPSLDVAAPTVGTLTGAPVYYADHPSTCDWLYFILTCRDIEAVKRMEAVVQKSCVIYQTVMLAEKLLKSFSNHIRSHTCFDNDLLQPFIVPMEIVIDNDTLICTDPQHFLKSADSRTRSLCSVSGNGMPRDWEGK